jgi:hypothetical protein
MLPLSGKALLNLAHFNQNSAIRIAYRNQRFVFAVNLL